MLHAISRYSYYIVVVPLAVLVACDGGPEHFQAPVATSQFSTLADNPAPVSANRFNPADAIGWHHATLLANLGQPDYRLQDGDRLLLQYDTRNCIIEFTLLPVRGRVKVTDWHIRGRSAAATVNLAACQRQLGRKISGSDGY